MLQELYHGRLNLSRLNYGVISLLPKIQDANIVSYSIDPYVF